MHRPFFMDDEDGVTEEQLLKYTEWATKSTGTTCWLTPPSSWESWQPPQQQSDRRAVRAGQRRGRAGGEGRDAGREQCAYRGVVRPVLR